MFHAERAAYAAAAAFLFLRVCSSQAKFVAEI
jgi:hypothetical protein